MSLKDCIKCVKKGYIYSGVSKSPCVYTMSAIKSSSSEIDKVTTKADCIISYPKIDEGLFGWGLSTAADLGIIFGILAAVLIIIFGYYVLKHKRLARLLKAVFFTLINSGLFPPLLALIPAPARSILTCIADVASQFSQYLQLKSSPGLTQQQQQQSLSITPPQFPGSAHLIDFSNLPSSRLEIEEIFSDNTSSHVLINMEGNLDDSPRALTFNDV